MSKKVCIFDIDNTLTHGADATPKICCPSGEKNCLVSKYQPQWPPKKSGTSQYALDTIKKCKGNGKELVKKTVCDHGQPQNGSKIEENGMQP